MIAAQEIAISNEAKILVAPEGTLNNNFNLASKSAISMLAGGFRTSKYELRSSLLGYQNGDQIYSSFIDKNRLVPFGEKTPRLFKIFSRGLSAVGGLKPGSSSRFFEWESTPPLAVAICYEISDGFKIRDAVKSGAE